VSGGLCTCACPNPIARRSASTKVVAIGSVGGDGDGGCSKEESGLLHARSIQVLGPNFHQNIRDKVA
jgi:hypothetical protein